VIRVSSFPTRKMLLLDVLQRSKLPISRHWTKQQINVRKLLRINL